MSKLDKKYDYYDMLDAYLYGIGVALGHLDKPGIDGLKAEFESWLAGEKFTTSEEVPDSGKDGDGNSVGVQEAADGSADADVSGHK